MTARVAEQLLRALHRRLDALEERAEAALGAATLGQTAYRRALEVLRHYPRVVRDIVEVERAASTDEDLQTFVQLLLRHGFKVVRFAQTWIFGAESMQDEPALLAMVRQECERLDLGVREPIVVPGSPDNFLTLPRDLQDVLFGGLAQLGFDVTAPEESSRFVLLQAPYFEGRRSPWYPIVLGHELAHLAVEEHGVVDDLPLSDAIGLDDLPEDLDGSPEAAVEFLRRAESWARELLCDAYMVRRFGPAAVCAMGEFLAAVGATDAPTSTHPLGRFRLALQLRWLGEVPDEFESALRPWQDLAAGAGRGLSPSETRLRDAFDELADDLAASMDWGPRYDVGSRLRIVKEVADLLRAGSPGAERVHLDSGLQDVEDADVLSASWLVVSEGIDDPTERLTAKALDTLVFVRRWTEAGGELHDLSGPPVPGGAPDAKSVLSWPELVDRLTRRSENRLGVTPLLAGAVGAAGLDIRLGNHFIVFQRTAVSSFDPLSTTDDPRSVQREVTRAWGEAFVLHPGELVLAATLEYLNLPADLTAQVITRSSYGRLGLITATAVQVNPWFRGCLTLELVNLGDVPLELTPGERIAQLVFQTVNAVEKPPPTKYDCSTGPQFSRVRDDADAEVLRQLRPADDL